jgi:proline dehydrogenase
MSRLTAVLRHRLARCLLPVAGRAARSYVAGPRVEDAVRLARALRGRGLCATLGYWDGSEDRPADVAAEYAAGVEAISAELAGDYYSIKLPSLGGDAGLLREVAGRAAARGVRLHFDSLGLETAQHTWAQIGRLAGSPPARAVGRCGGASCGNPVGSDGALALGATLPARWRRSLDDALRAVELGVVPRVVKGQWEDPDDPARDARSGFLELIDRLAGRAGRVAVATHDLPLACEAARRLRGRGTVCELELLIGLPDRGYARLARDLGVPLRYYVPYGEAYLPYCLSQLRRRPRLAWWLLRDCVTGAVRGGS